MTAPTEEDYQEMSKAWCISVDRLKFLASCPHNNGDGYIKVDRFKGEEKAIAKAIHTAIHGSWTMQDAATIGGYKVEVIAAFVAKHGIRWPEGCRRRLEWGRGTTRTHQLTEEHANLLAKGRLSMKEAAAKGVAEGLTANETALKYGFSAPGMYNAAVRQGLRFVAHKAKFGTKGYGRPKVNQ